MLLPLSTESFSPLAEKYGIKLTTLKSLKSRDGKEGNPRTRDATCVMKLLKAIKLEHKPKLNYVVFSDIKDSINKCQLIYVQKRSLNCV